MLHYVIRKPTLTLQILALALFHLTVYVQFKRQSESIHRTLKNQMTEITKHPRTR